MKIRFIYFILIISVIALGLLSRTSYTPEWIYPYLGDFLYTVMFYFIFAFLFPHWKALHLMILAIATCFIIEILQLYQASWIVELRATKVGKLILGSGFLWSDLVAYTLGGFFACCIDIYAVRKWNKNFD